ncbi:hypothetical protein J6590_073986 [Homalodisca vitripennis]|nr:hypothetical protein J6590_073986 [Homalodisca vitripennis]
MTFVNTQPVDLHLPITTSHLSIGLRTRKEDTYQEEQQAEHWRRVKTPVQSRVQIYIGGSTNPNRRRRRMFVRSISLNSSSTNFDAEANL